MRRMNGGFPRVAGFAAAALLALSGATVAVREAAAQEGHSNIAEEDLAPNDAGLAKKPAPDADWDGTPGRPAAGTVEHTETTTRTTTTTESGGAAGTVEHSMDTAGDKTRGGIEKAGEATGKALDKAITKTGEGVGYVVDKTGQGLRKAGEALSGEK